QENAQRQSGRLLSRAGFSSRLQNAVFFHPLSFNNLLDLFVARGVLSFPNANQLQQSLLPLFGNRLCALVRFGGRKRRAKDCHFLAFRKAHVVGQDYNTILHTALRNHGESPKLTLTSPAPALPRDGARWLRTLGV